MDIFNFIKGNCRLDEEAIASRPAPAETSQPQTEQETVGVENVTTSPPSSPIVAATTEDSQKPFTGFRLSSVPFYNVTKPYREILHESPRHRMVCDLKITGRYTNVQIAEVTELTPTTIGTILKQDWALKYMSDRMNETNISEMDSAFSHLRGLAIEAVSKQEAIMSLPIEDIYEDGKLIIKGHAETIRKTTNDILNRAYGTPKQFLEVSNKDVSTVSDEELSKIVNSAKQN